MGAMDTILGPNVRAAIGSEMDHNPIAFTERGERKDHFQLRLTAVAQVWDHYLYKTKSKEYRNGIQETLAPN